MKVDYLNMALAGVVLYVGYRVVKAGDNIGGAIAGLPKAASDAVVGSKTVAAVSNPASRKLGDWFTDFFNPELNRQAEDLEKTVVTPQASNRMQAKAGVNWESYL